jgi:cysteinyl-tRNA synthetase
VLFELAREINRGREESSDVAAAQDILTELAGVLGFTLEEPKKPPLKVAPFIGLISQLGVEFSKAPRNEAVTKIESLLAGATRGTKPPDAEQLIQLLIKAREELRRAKQWQLADTVRQHLTGLGIALEDTPQGTIWKRML